MATMMQDEITDSLFAHLMGAAPTETTHLGEADAGAVTLSDRQRVIESIVTVNPRVTREWLDRFKDEPLRLYLCHLEAAARPRGRLAAWVRPGDTPALVCGVAPE